MRVLFAAPEAAPWVKTGGLGDVAGALPPALARCGCDVRVLLPAHPALVRALGDAGEVVAELPTPGGEMPPARIRLRARADGPDLLLVDAPGLSDREGDPYQSPQRVDWPDNDLRFGLLARVAALLGSEDSPLGWRPEILHCNDWQTGLAPAYLHYLHAGRRASTVVTIHNLAFMGLFGRGTLARVGLPEHAFAYDGVEFHGRVSFLKAGLQFADLITTVSPGYAREILTPELGWGLEGLLRWRADRLVGILNGIDTKAWNPASDRALARNYDARRLAGKAGCKAALQAQMGLEPDAASPLLGVVSRFTEQKGQDLLLDAADALVEDGAQFAVLGSGEPWLEQRWRELAGRHAARCAVRIGFDETLAHRIEAGADIFVMPSRFEPCGLNQMYSLRYGTVPVVRRTGGLGDTVVDASPAAIAEGTANGFVFDAPEAPALLHAVRRAISARRDPALWKRLMRTGMVADHGWLDAASSYLEQYWRLRP